MEEYMVIQETVPNKNKVKSKVLPVPVMSEEEEYRAFVKQFEMTEKEMERVKAKKRHTLQPKT
jgi:hypothetical protein